MDSCPVLETRHENEPKKFIRNFFVFKNTELFYWNTELFWAFTSGWGLRRLYCSPSKNIQFSTFLTILRVKIIYSFIRCAEGARKYHFKVVKKHKTRQNYKKNMGIFFMTESYGIFLLFPRNRFCLKKYTLFRTEQVYWVKFYVE